MDKFETPNYDKVGDTMIITPHVVNTLFYLIILLGGLDFILSGLKVLTRTIPSPIKAEKGVH